MLRQMPRSQIPLFDADVSDSATAFDAAPVTAPVLLPLALNDPYDYLVGDEPLSPGEFVVVPLGPVKRIGVVWRDSGNRPQARRSAQAEAGHRQAR